MVLSFNRDGYRVKRLVGRFGDEFRGIVAPHEKNRNRGYLAIVEPIDPVFILISSKTMEAVTRLPACMLKPRSTLR